MTIGMLSWGSDKTLRQTLGSYAFHRYGVDEEKLIFLQEATAHQISLVRAYQWTPVICSVNLGIARAYANLVNAASEPFFTFLENDWRLIESRHSVETKFAKNLILRDEADLVRLRHRQNPGSPLWTRQFEGREYDRPTHLLDSVHWTDPSKFPEVSTKTFEYVSYDFDINGSQSMAVEQKKSTWYITSSKYANWTNNPHMAYTSFLRENVLPRLGSDDLERDIQSWWEQQDFKVAQGEGLFTHDRID